MNRRVTKIFVFIRDGRWAKHVTELRGFAYGSAAYNAKKKTLPCFMLSASTATGGHTAAGILEHSGLLQIDVDSIGMGAACALRDRLAKDPHVLASWLSPGGEGVKAAFRIPASVDTHKKAFVAAQRYFQEVYGVTVDPSCKDPCRLCFVSHDPNLRTNENAIELQIEGLSADAIVQSDGDTERQSNVETEAHRHTVTEVVSVVGSVEEAVQLALPSTPGRNHDFLFLLARAVKALERIDGQFHADRLRQVFETWYQPATPFLRPGHTKGEYYMEFLAAYDSAKYPLGAGVIEEAWRRAQTAITPPDIIAFTDDPQIRLAAALCRELQRMHGDNPFFLSARTLAGLLKHDTHSTAATWLRAFRGAKILKEIHKGAGDRASRYRYLFIP